MVMYLDLPNVTCSRGTIYLPGSKSISNRILLLSSLAQEKTEISGLLDCDDTNIMLMNLKQLGISINKTENDLIEIIGSRQFPVKYGDFFLGNAGTAFRPLTAVLSLLGGNYRLFGTKRMLERPIGDLVDSLRSLGADIKYINQKNYPPLLINSNNIVKRDFIQINGSISSQFLTALLIAAPIYTQKTNQPLTIKVKGHLTSKPYIDITLDAMKQFNIDIKLNGKNCFTIPKNSIYRSPGKIFIEGDVSSASYFLAAGSIGGGPVCVKGVGEKSIQGDLEFTEILKYLGSDISFGPYWIESRGIKVANGQKFKAFDLDFNRIPDAAMTAAVLALYADGPCRLRNIGNWRLKETDRIYAMQTELRKLGAKVDSGTDWLIVKPVLREMWQDAEIDTWDDHRMAMCFSLAAFGPAKIRINNPGCVSKTFPNYFNIYKSLF